MAERKTGKIPHKKGKNLKISLVQHYGCISQKRLDNSKIFEFPSFPPPPPSPQKQGNNIEIALMPSFLALEQNKNLFLKFFHPEMVLWISPWL